MPLLHWWSGQAKMVTVAARPAAEVAAVADGNGGGGRLGEIWKSGREHKTLGVVCTLCANPPSMLCGLSSSHQCTLCADPSVPPAWKNPDNSPLP